MEVKQECDEEADPTTSGVTGEEVGHVRYRRFIVTTSIVTHQLPK